jgi:hypothetical protein
MGATDAGGTDQGWVLSSGYALAAMLMSKLRPGDAIAVNAGTLRAIDVTPSSHSQLAHRDVALVWRGSGPSDSDVLVSNPADVRDGAAAQFAGVRMADVADMEAFRAGFSELREHVRAFVSERDQREGDAAWAAATEANGGRSPGFGDGTCL